MKNPKAVASIGTAAIVAVGVVGYKAANQSPAVPTPPAPAFIRHTNVVIGPPRPQTNYVAFRYKPGTTTQSFSYTYWDVATQKRITNTVTLPVQYEVQSWSGSGRSWTTYTNFSFDGSNITVNANEPEKLFRIVLYP